MQPIPIPEIDSRHADPLPALIALVIGFDFIDPVITHILGYILAEANVDEEVGVLFAGLEVWRG